MEKTNPKNKFSSKRILNLILCFFVFVALSLALCLKNSVLLDDFICILVIDIVFFIFFVITINRLRLQKKLPLKHSISYGKTLLVLLIGSACMIGFSFVPPYFAPVMIVGAMLTCVFDDFLSTCVAIFFNCILCMTCAYGNTVLICYIILSITGIMLGRYFESHSFINNIDSYIIIFATNTIVISVFYYFSHSKYSLKIFVFAAVMGLINCLFIGLIVPAFYKMVEKAEVNIFDNLLDENFPLVLNIRTFSTIAYNHAAKVSNLSRKCALEIEANADVAAVGGFYYRIGRMLGEPEIDNAVKLLTDYCFPEEVISIIRQFMGLVEKPDSLESAIVNMVDAIVTKIELLGDENMSSDWNQDMVIYQTINNLSSTGIYDNSGLTMNQLLKIREALVKENIQ